MALPPQTLRIKRKRDEAPVDTLSIQSASSSKRVLSQFVFHRQKNDERTPEFLLHAGVLNSSNPPQIPETGQVTHEESPSTEQNNSLGASTTSTDTGTVGPRFRRFYMSRVDKFHPYRRGTAKDPSLRVPTTEEVVFMEDVQLISSQEVTVTGEQSNFDTSFVKDSSDTIMDNPVVGGGSDVQQSTDASQRIYEEMLRDVREHEEVAEGSSSNEYELDSHEKDITMSDEWVYDTFYRQDNLVSTKDSIAIVTNNHGLLVIEAEDEETFFLYDDDEEEYDWDTEQDDENAENFYGNDYPDADVWSDDDDLDPYAIEKDKWSEDREY